MKKVFIIIAICLLIIGLGLSVAGLAMTDFNFKGLDNMEYTEKSYTENAQSVKKLIVSDFNRRIEIKNSADDQIHVYYFESEKEFYNISLSGDVLTITAENTMKWFDYIRFRWFNNPVLRIELPQNTVSEIIAETKNGEIIAEDLSTSGDISLTTYNGSVLADDISCQNFKGENYNGKVKIDGLTATDIVSETKNGNIEIKNSVSQTLTATDYNGAIELSAVDTSKAVFKNHNGRIHGSLIGTLDEFSVQTSAKNGSCNLPNYKPTGEKSIVAETYNGAIYITFSAD